MASTTYALAPAALKKLALHRAKHRGESVVGLLLGATSGTSLMVADTVPLAHTLPELTPMLEFALAVAEARFGGGGDDGEGGSGSGSGLSVVGAYVLEACALVGDPPALALALGARLRASSDLGSSTPPLVVVADGVAPPFADDSGPNLGLAFLAPTKSDGLGPIESDAVDLADIATWLATDGASPAAATALADFADHLENVGSGADPFDPTANAV